MPWFQIDDRLTTNPKVRSLLDSSLDGDYRGPAALGLWAAAGADIQQSTLDGMISRAGLVRIALNPVVVDELAGRLVDAGLWHVAGHTCSRCTQPPPGYFLFHDWSDYGYATREEKGLKDRKAKELKDSRIRAEVWARDCVSPDRPREADCRYCGKRVRQKDSRGAPGDRAHLDHVDPTAAIGSTNIVIACGDCNSRKGQRQLSQTDVGPLRPPPAHNGPQGVAAEPPVSPTAVAEPASPASSSAETTVSQGQAAADAGSPAGRPQAPDSPPPAPKARPPARPPAPDHPETTLEPDVESARSTVLARTRADARRSGSGPGSGLGKGQGSGQGEGRGHGQGQGAAPGRRRRRRRGRGGGRGSAPAEGGPGPAAPPVGAAGHPPEVYVPGRFGSPWAQWSGPPSTVTDTDCDRHGLPQPCRKCVDEEL